MTLYNKLKKGISTVLLSTVIYASAILPVQAQQQPQMPPAQAQEVQQPRMPPEMDLFLFSDRDKERYKNNPSAFSEYNPIYNQLNSDGKISFEDLTALGEVVKRIKCEKFGVYHKFEEYEDLFFRKTKFSDLITSRTVERLEEELSKAVESFEKEYTDENKKLKIVAGETPKAYLTCSLRKNDLKLLRDALKVKSDYLNRKWGNNSFISLGLTQNYEDTFNKSYQSSLEDVFNKDFYALSGKSYKLTKLTDEFPIKTKIPFWPGLLLGIAPLLAQLAGKIKRKEKISLRNQMLPIFIHGNGITFYDSLHPLVYPIRVSGSLAWEGYKMHKYNNANKSQKTIPPPKLTKPSNIDPWCELEDIPKKEEKTVDPWVKLENKLQ